MYDIFSLPDVKFPQNFIWGSATAGHQVEGDNIHSNWWALEQNGKVGTKSGKACNHYSLYKQDVELLKSLGHRAYRMSIEWSRIEPAEGAFNAEAMAHYIDLLVRLKEAGMTVYVTLHHFTHPQWFEELGGFQKLSNLKYFERFINHAVPKIAQFVDYWNVINEFNLGNAEARIDFKLNMLRYHARGYHLIKQYSSAPISSAHAFVHYFPYRRHDKFDNIMTDLQDWRDNEFFFHAIRTGEIVFPFRDAEFDPEVKGSADFWAVNYYTRHMVDARLAALEGKRFEHKTLKMIPMNFYLEEMFPEGLISNLERLKDRPVHITENGCSCDDDRFRIAYIALHLSALREAIARGVDLRAYLYWSFMDNYEWGSFVPRFGLVNVNFETFERTPKPSAYFYRDIINENGFNQAIIRKHISELPTLMK
ncbi:MAG TPA: glycoside hydrolase family 1 protein [Candidatus Wallbacteria bacterium]|nr:glycoside hydrolase family 1 protein [Candidatus Wallbacteria bacterium]